VRASAYDGRIRVDVHIARSIVEAHGGWLDVESAARRRARRSR
jgi:hypothetical protein